MFCIFKKSLNSSALKDIRLYNVVKRRITAASSSSSSSAFTPLKKPALQGLQAYRSYSKVNLIGQTPAPKQLTKKECEERVMKAIKAWDRFPHDRLEKLHLNARFQEDLSFDSLDHVEIIMALEDEFHMEITDTDAEKLKTPNDMIKYICEKEDVFE